jgi:hypothetical protein
MVGLLLCVAIVYGGTYWFSHKVRQPAVGVGPEPAATSSISTQTEGTGVPVVSVPTVVPPPRPTPIIDGASSQGSGATAEWPVTKTTDPQSGRTYWMAPADVVSRVRKDYQELNDYYNAHVFDKNPDDAKQFYAEPMLDEVMKSQQQELTSNEVRGAISFQRPDLQILGFSPDGLAAQVAQEFHGETVPVYRRSNHQLIREEKLPVGLDYSTMVYDRQDQRWKVSENVFIPGPPGVK